MAISAANYAHIKAHWQNFVVEFVVFPPISWTVGGISPTTITWEPFCLMSPRYAYTAGPDVLIWGDDSYNRGGAAASVVFSKASGVGTVTDNADGTCTVSGASGVVVVEGTATESGQTATSYAQVYGGSTGNMRAIVSRVDGFSGSLSTGEWQADMVLRGDYSGVLTNDGRDQPILMHVIHYWDGASDTFGGYQRHNNTFVLLCRESTIHCKHSGEYETILHLETPGYVLKRTRLINGEANFGTDPASDYVVTNLTPTDVLYYLLRKVTNLHQYFNMSIWNNASTMSNLHVRPDASIWEYAKDAVGRNFGMAYFNRWSNLSVKPDPRVRYDEWNALVTQPYNNVVPLTQDRMLEYELHHLREDNVHGVGLQAVLPDLTVYEVQATATAGIGERMEFTGLMASSSGEVNNWASQIGYWQNTPYSMDFRMGMGHELNPGDGFTLEAGFAPPIGDSPSAAQTSWIVDDINYEFDFVRGFWTRRISATMISTGE